MECSRPLYTNRPSGSAVIRPGNVWLTSDGIAKIGDFGLAVALDRSRLTTEGMMALNPSSRNAHQAGFSQDTASNGELLRLKYLPPSQHPLHQGPHPQLTGDGQGLVQQGHGFGPVPLTVTLEKGVGVVAAGPG